METVAFKECTLLKWSRPSHLDSLDMNYTVPLQDAWFLEGAQKPLVDQNFDMWLGSRKEEKKILQSCYICSKSKSFRVAIFAHRFWLAGKIGKIFNQRPNPKNVISLGVFFKMINIKYQKQYKKIICIYF